MGSCIHSIQEPCGTEQQRTRANSSQCFRMCSPLPQPRMKHIVLHMMSESPAARDDNNVEVGTVRCGVMRDDLHSASCGHYSWTLRYEERLERRKFVASPLFIQSSNGKNLKWTTEVEYLDLFVDEDSDAFSFHRNLGARFHW